RPAPEDPSSRWSSATPAFGWETTGWSRRSRRSCRHGSRDWCCGTCRSGESTTTSWSTPKAAGSSRTTAARLDDPASPRADNAGAGDSRGRPAHGDAGARLSRARGGRHGGISRISDPLLPRLEEQRGADLPRPGRRTGGAALGRRGRRERGVHRARREGAPGTGGLGWRRCPSRRLGCDADAGIPAERCRAQGDPGLVPARLDAGRARLPVRSPPTPAVRRAGLLRGRGIAPGGEPRSAARRGAAAPAPAAPRPQPGRPAYAAAADTRVLPIRYAVDRAG